MRLPRSLRARIVLACFGSGAGLSVLFAVLVMGAVDMVEYEFTGRMLQDELDYFVSQHEAHPESLPPSSHALHGYVVEPGGSGDLPEAFADLPDGMSEVYVDGRELHVFATDVGPRRYYLAYDFTLFEQREVIVLWMVVIVALTVTAFAAWAGLWLSGRVIAPVSRLAEQVSNRGSLAHGPARPFADGFGDDEVGVLARAFDAYVARLDAFVERERRFTGEASHELRTPLAVIASTVEVLLTDDSLGAKTRSRLLRLQRGVKAMSSVVQSLLELARAEAVTAREELVAVGTVLAEVIEEHRPLLDGRPVALNAQVEPGSGPRASPGMLRIVLGNLIRNAFGYTDRGSVHIALAEATVRITDSGIGIAPDELERVFEPRFRGANSAGEGAGLGLAMVKRVCERCGWSISLDSAPGRGTQVELVIGHGIVN